MKNLLLPKHWPLSIVALLVVISLAELLVSSSDNWSPPGMLGLATVTIVGTCLAVLFAKRDITRQGQLFWTVFVVGALCLSAMAIPGISSSHWALTGCGLILGSLILAFNFRASTSDDAAVVSQSLQLREEKPETESTEVFASLEERLLANLPDESESKENIQFEMSRLLRDNGSEIISGRQMVTFAEGERIQHCHIPISPALRGSLNTWCECDHAAVTTDFSVVQSYGVRITIRLSNQALDIDKVEVAFSIESQESANAVA